jgi:hypothetical protein
VVNFECNDDPEDDVCQLFYVFESGFDYCQNNNEKTYYEDITNEYGGRSQTIFWKCCQNLKNETSCKIKIFECNSNFFNE